MAPKTEHKRHSSNIKLIDVLASIYGAVQITIKHKILCAASMVRDAKANRFRYSIDGQAKAKGLLREYLRKTVQKILSGGSAPAG